MKLLRRQPHRMLFVLGSIVFVGVLVLGVTSGRAYLFSSRAEEENTSVVYTQSSTSVVSYNVPDGSCVESLSYLPDLNDTTTTCFSQFTCDGENNEIEKDTCVRTSEMLREAEEICRCSE